MYPIIFEFQPAEFAKIVREHGSFVLTTHLNPDGDALGSELGLAEWLLSIGKSVRVINHSPNPEQYHFLDAERSIIEVYDPAKHDEVFAKTEVLMLLDTNDPDRAKSTGPFLLQHPMTVLVDHHLEPKDFAKHRFIDTEATSTGEMVFRLISECSKMLGGTISQKAAQALYVAIMTDTGSFRFPRTDSEILRIAAELIDLGADPVKTYNETYNTAKPSRIKLFAQCISSLKMSLDDRLATLLVTLDDLKAAGAIDEEVDGFVQFPLQVGTIEFSIFFLERKDGWKLSFRSRGSRSAAAVAKEFGGNGHFNAAGARMISDLSYEELRKKVVEAVERELAKPV